MSKQIKLKFKKMLKKAEFVHADLEYHEELFEDAKAEFTQAFAEIVGSLSAEDKLEFDRLSAEVMQQRLAELEKAIGESQVDEDEDDEEENKSRDLVVTDDFPDGIDLDVEQKGDVPEAKAVEMKKLFYKIASLTHPDKLAASGLPEEHVQRSEQIFKKARTAYENGNWYILYSIALDLDIDVGDAGEHHIEWMENDIRFTMGHIAHVAQLAAWVWYTGDEKAKLNLMKGYFKQVYNFDWVPPTDSP
tara:strand:+ start:265 stop:1005 length:741 start_codon:yes stop_codon:yes gene_type:complete